MDFMDYEKNARYFNDYSSAHSVFAMIGAVALILFGVFVIKHAILTFIQGESAISMTIFSTMLIIAGGALVRLSLSIKKRKPVSDSEYDSDVERYAADLVKARALRKLGIGRSEVSKMPTVTFGGYTSTDITISDTIFRILYILLCMFVPYSNPSDIREYKCRIGLDKRWRSSLYRVFMLFFSSDKIYCYEAKFETTLSAMPEEEAYTYSYRDVVLSPTVSGATEVKFGDKKLTVSPEAVILKKKRVKAREVHLLHSQNPEKTLSALLSLLHRKSHA